MKPNIFAKLLMVIIIGTTLIGLGCCFVVVPDFMTLFPSYYPEFSNWIIPWMVLIYICAVPCFGAMGISWKIASNIRKDRSFCYENARLFRIFSYLALGDSIVLGLGSVAYWLCGLNHPGLLVIEFLVVFVGLAIYACTSALSYLVAQAAALQEDSDLTI